VRVPFAVLLVLLAPFAAGRTPAAQPLLRRTIPLPGVHGRIGHLAYDPATQRLFVAAYGNGSLEVVDLAAGRRTASVSGLKHPRGITVVPDTGLAIVACAGDGTVRAYDARTLEEKSARSAGRNAEHVLFNDRTGQLLVGYGSGGLMILQPRSLNQVDQVALRGHPASFQLDPESSRVFINVPGNWLFGGGRVVVANLDSRQVINTWELKGVGLNYPMAYDAGRERLYIVCRRPARLVTIDANTGQTVSTAECAGDADDMFLDPDTHRLYVIGGAGQTDVFDCSEPSCTETASLETAPGARTGLLLPERRSLYIAVPSRMGQSAEIREYALIQ
jgi:DNA-binding beta-propeller fold protein YncE